MPVSEPLEYWIYVSEAKVGANSADAALIYLQARNGNAEHGVTGYLHREDDRFVQYVEGPGPVLARLKELIRADPRHAMLRELGRGPLDARRFEGWDMAFTEEERHLYRSWRAARGEDGDIVAAGAEDILAFMDDAVRSGAAGRS